MNKSIVKNEKNYNVCDLLLLDHGYLKECIDILSSNNYDKKVKLKIGKSFVDAVLKHSLAEEKCVYGPLAEIDMFKKEIIAHEIEHGVSEDKAKYIFKTISGKTNLTDNCEAELKVLAGMVKKHVIEEEDNLITEMRACLDEEILEEMGLQFMRLRQFTAKDLQDYPELKQDLKSIQSMSNRMPQNFHGRIKESVNNYLNQ